jgi:hypothetical protein
MKRVFRVKIMIGESERTIYLTGHKATEVRAKLVRNGHSESAILSTTAIHDASEEVPGRIYGVIA